jgi:hypothetical protein
MKEFLRTQAQDATPNDDRLEAGRSSGSIAATNETHALENLGRRFRGASSSAAHGARGFRNPRRF